MTRFAEHGAPERGSDGCRRPDRSGGLTIPNALLCSLIASVLLLSSVRPLPAQADWASRCADRAAIERVYHDHRTGTKPPFEKLLPPDRIEQLVRKDQQKEDVLRKVYGTEISAAQVEAEVQRIESTSRAPGTLKELKHSLGDDPGRFARTVARPIVVERELRRHFENDPVLHAAQRHEVERLRERLMAVRREGAAAPRLQAVFHAAASNFVHDVEWRMVSDNPPPPATASTPPKDLLPLFEDLQPDLRKVLRVQLREAGDVSGVIESPGELMLFLLLEKTATRLKAAVFSQPKRSLESWLEENARRR